VTVAATTVYDGMQNDIMIATCAVTTRTLKTFKGCVPNSGTETKALLHELFIALPGQKSPMP
jgi:hypothetical protein